ncbi:hypothetical protein [Cryptosporangium minutisporangium]|uniref:Integral membrane protein n=1 Tax=Cryptosporangium minutisporangium TaxID=113569 RepID=A0ABP6SSR3_9ACTN
MTATPSPATSPGGQPTAGQPTAADQSLAPEPHHDGDTRPPGAVPDDDELVRLRAEVAALRERLAAPPRQRTGITTARRFVAATLVVIAAFALVTSVVGLWAARTTLETDRWVATVAPLPQDPKVSAAVAEYATTELFRVLDVDQRLREVLPPQAGFVVGPLTGQMREQVRRTVDTVLTSDRFQAIWVGLNQELHQRLLAVIEGESDLITARDDRIQINLLPLINQVLRELSAELPTLFGKQISLPDLSSGEIPANLRARVESALGVALPANFAQFTVYDAGQLQAAQEAVATAKRDLAIFVGATIVLLLAAFAISPLRRRTAVQLGIWLVIAAVAITAILRAIRRQVLAEVPDGVYRDGVDAALTTVLSSLRERGTQLIWIGIALALIAYLVGPGVLPVWLRRQVRRGAAGGVRWTRTGAGALATRGPGFVVRYLDPLRIVGLVVAGILALVFSSWTALLIILVVLVAYEVTVTLIGRGQQERLA